MNQEVLLATENIVEATREQFRARLSELQPFLDEARQIEQTLSFMEQAEGVKPSSRRRGRRPKGEPTRLDEFLKVVRDNPGITVTEAAEKLGLKDRKGYLYRIAAQATDDGHVKKDGRGYTASTPVEDEQPVAA